MRRPPEAPEDASPMSSTPPTSFRPPPEPAVFARDVRRTSRGAVLALLGASLIALITAVVVVGPLMRKAREQADAALDQLGDLDPPPFGPAPDDVPAVTEPVDGRYGLDT